MSKIPKYTQFTFTEKTVIHLVGQELKSRYFFKTLRELGLDDDFYQTDLLHLIMTIMGLPYDVDEHYSFCYNRLDWCSGHLNIYNGRLSRRPDILLREALSAYTDLLDHALQHGFTPQYEHRYILKAL